MTDIYWPGTKIVKSQGNAFTSWKQTPSLVTSSKDWRQSVAATRTMQVHNNKSFTVYTRAKASK